MYVFRYRYLCRLFDFMTKFLTLDACYITWYRGKWLSQVAQYLKKKQLTELKLKYAELHMKVRIRFPHCNLNIIDWGLNKNKCISIETSMMFPTEPVHWNFIQDIQIVNVAPQTPIYFSPRFRLFVQCRNEMIEIPRCITTMLTNHLSISI